jgi:hypothetical protein
MNTLATANWGFESGDFTGWDTVAAGGGAWRVYADGATPPDPADSDPQCPFEVPDPPEGRFAAVTDMSAAGTRILYRDVVLEEPSRLRFTLFYDNAVGEFAAPEHLDFARCEPNQQFRVDIVDPTAPVHSLAPQHVLATIFLTAPGDPESLGPRTISVDLSPWAGRAVRLRFAQVDNRGPLRAGVDDVRVEPIAA